MRRKSSILNKINPILIQLLEEQTNNKPLSNCFSWDRGTPIDRYYIDKFISQNACYIQGRVLEVGDNRYTRKYGSNILSSDILHKTGEDKSTTIIQDLENLEFSLPKNYDCIVCTQTLQYIYYISTAIINFSKFLADDGIVLATCTGISQISNYDKERWGDYWRFTTESLYRKFSSAFKYVEVKSYGNMITSIAFLLGMSLEEISNSILDYNDPNYQLVLTVRARASKVKIWN